MPESKMKKGFALLLLLLFSCTYTVTKIKTPEFAGSTDSLAADLSGIIACQHIQVDGKEVTTNGKPSSQLEIDIINGKGVPETNDGIKALAHSIAVEVRKFLKDKSEYETYSVLFVKMEQSSSVTKRTWKGYEFKVTEL